MSQLLLAAIAKAQSLPTEEQDALGQLILDELADEQHWGEQFARTQEQLARMAEQARAQISAGKVRRIVRFFGLKGRLYQPRPKAWGWRWPESATLKGSFIAP